MALLRKIALGLLLATSAGVLGMAAWELWNYHQATSLPLSDRGFNTSDRARILQSRVDLLTMRVKDMELLVLILLGASGLYSIVSVVSSYFTASSFGRHADQTISRIRDQIGLAMGDLRELQEETKRRLGEMTAVPKVPVPDGWGTKIAEIAERVAAYQDESRQSRTLSERSRLELIEDERQATYLEKMAVASDSSSLAILYLGFSKIYASLDLVRSRFYLERALRLAVPKSALASEIHYHLACRLAATHDFPRAMRELSAAFEHQFKALDERLANDIEEGGELYQLASTEPFDKAVNDLLLNMSIGLR